MICGNFFYVQLCSPVRKKPVQSGIHGPSIWSIVLIDVFSNVEGLYYGPLVQAHAFFEGIRSTGRVLLVICDDVLVMPRFQVSKNGARTGDHRIFFGK